MIIPERCFSCGKPIGHLWEEFKQRVEEKGEDSKEVMDELDSDGIYIVYCSGEECSLSLDLADHLYNEKLIDKLLIFEGGWPQIGRAHV